MLTLQEKLGYSFKNIVLLKSALDRSVKTALYTDESAVGKTMVTVPNHEHLECLGDRVLNLCIISALSTIHPDWTPRQLTDQYVTYTRNADISKAHGGPLYRIAKELDLESNLVLKPDEILDKGGKRGKAIGYKKKTKEHILSDHVESIFGAIFIDTGKDLVKTNEIVHRLFEPLGLFESEHASMTDYGASAIEMVSIIEHEIIDVAIRQRFISLVSAGHMDELKMAGLAVDDETIQDAYYVALTNGMVNMVPYLVQNYPHALDAEMIEQSLEDESLASSIRGFLARYLMRLKRNDLERKISGKIDRLDVIDEAHDLVKLAAPAVLEPEIIKTAVETADENHRNFLKLAAAGNQEMLIEANFEVPSDIAIQGFILAINNKRVNIVPYIVHRYGIKAETIKETLAGPMPSQIKGYLEKCLRKLEIAALSDAIAGAGLATPLRHASAITPDKPLESTASLDASDETIASPITLRDSALAKPSVFAKGLAGIEMKAITVPASEMIEESHARFLKLAAAGQQQALLEADLDIPYDIAIQGFTLAINNKRFNIVPYIVHRYSIDAATIQKALEGTLSPDIKGYLEKHLRKLVATASYEASAVMP